MKRNYHQDLCGAQITLIISQKHGTQLWPHFSLLPSISVQSQFPYNYNNYNYYNPNLPNNNNQLDVRLQMCVFCGNFSFFRSKFLLDLIRSSSKAIALENIFRMFNCNSFSTQPRFELDISLNYKDKQLDIFTVFTIYNDCDSQFVSL